MISTKAFLFAAAFMSLTHVNAQSIDSTFATNGYLTYGGPQSNSENNAGAGLCTVLQPDGKIVVGIAKENPNQNDWYYYTYRYNTDGTPDATFGDNGVSKIFTGDQCRNYEMHIQPDGNIVSIGESKYCEDGVCGTAQFVMMRLQTNGLLDSTFGNNGMLITPDLFGTFGLIAIGYACKLLPDGKFIIGGRSPYNKSFIARLKSNGYLDSTYAANGVYLDTTTYYGFKDLAVDDQGNAFGLLESHNILGSATDSSNISDSYIFKLDEDGSLDISFGNGGHRTMSFFNDDNPSSLALKSDNDIVVSGDKWLAFIQADGNLSPAVPNGYKEYNIPDGNLALEKVVVFDDNRLMLAGKTWNDVAGNFPEKAFLGQVNALGNFHSDFNYSGYMIFDYGLIGAWPQWTGSLSTFMDVDVASPGVIYATGYRNPTAGSTDRAVFLMKSIDVNTGTATSLSNKLATDDFILFPNPASSEFVIESAQKSSFTIFDLSGNAVLSGKFNEGNLTISIPTQLARGIYLLEIENEVNGHRSMKKFIVQ